MNIEDNISLQRQGRSLDNGRGVKSTDPIRDSFIPPSPNRTHTLSPKRAARQSVHINMDLTEYQVDRLTDAFSSGVGSPCREKARASTTDGLSSSAMTRSSLAASTNSTGHTHDTSQSRINMHKDLERLDEMVDAERAADDGRRRRQDTSNQPRDSKPGHRSRDAPRSDTLAQRRNIATPNEINVEDTRKYGTYVHRANTVPASSHPLTYNLRESSPFDDDMSSLYSQDASITTPHEGPAYLGGDTVSQNIENVMYTYKGWAAPSPVAHMPPTQPRTLSPVRQNGRPRGQSPVRGTETKARAQVLKNAEANFASYSPLTTYFAFEGVPVQKVGGKTMIGHQGWLERPTADDPTPNDQQKKDFSPKKLGLLDSIKRMAKDMTPSKNSRRSRDADKTPRVPRIIISLNPREQSLLYCELEFHISNALHAYITNELNHGRLDPNKLKKIADGWGQKGRPKVMGFRYDLETQLDLLDLHTEDFRFFGRRQGNPVEIAGLLHAMKVNARALRIRTFCQPDSVIAKQLVDSQSLFNTIGCSEVQQIALAEIAQFFKVIVERERHHRDRLRRPDEKAGTVAGAHEAHPGTRWELQPGNDPTPEGTFDVFGSMARTEHDDERKPAHSRGQHPARCQRYSG
ncbi:hypothetical protein F5X68DRAFT_173408 [Plectosphaerella plurivora]|uniref:Uncharacterized protein n=1 Tax=Plectosphaerella plurivora TaxID=936078 RepID=A0A9P8V6E8_9PEZI|nr:hypothetical protein F5X68DRAFT_173408 [Plectosphaerella plurivora]